MNEHQIVAECGRTAGEITITRWGNSRHWAVWIAGELLAVVEYRKGALAIGRKIASMTDSTYSGAALAVAE
jgi:hypothetical protein